MHEPPSRLTVSELFDVDSDYALAHPIHSVEYREFVLKYMLTYGFEETPTFYDSPLWEEYTWRILFSHVLDTVRVTENAVPVYRLREGVVERLCPEGATHE